METGRDNFKNNGVMDRVTDFYFTECSICALDNAVNQYNGN